MADNKNKNTMGSAFGQLVSDYTELEDKALRRHRMSGILGVCALPFCVWFAFATPAAGIILLLCLAIIIHGGIKSHRELKNRQEKSSGEK